MQTIHELNGLSNPDNFENEINIDGLENQSHKFLEQMLCIRAAERKIADGKKNGLIGGPVHLGVGQEAVAVGVAGSLRTTDRIFGAHRSHSHILSMEIDFTALFAEVLGESSGIFERYGELDASVEPTVWFLWVSPNCIRHGSAGRRCWSCSENARIR